jgi:putative spermidine/putrescine transport system permease protein
MGWVGLLPFSAYVIIFLGIPTVLAVVSGFQDGTGAFTFTNFAALGDPLILQAFGVTILISAVTAVIGAIVGALVCFALLGTKPDGWLRTFVDSASSVLAQFGGVMLAFAFVATVGVTGFVTKLLVQWGWTDNPFGANGPGGPLLYQTTGLVVVYLYFQVPLMVLTFMPALSGLKASWAEANATLGGTRLTYWLRIGIPVLAPAFLGSLVLLFANAFSSYATAAVLIPNGGIIPLAIRQQLTSETILGLANVAGVLALGMVVIMVVLMTVYAYLQGRARRWQR